MRLLENINEQDLDILEGLSNDIAYKVLQKIRKNLISAMKEKAFNTIHITEEQRLEHARQLGHIQAWDTDDSIPSLVKKEKETRDKFKKIEQEKMEKV